MVLRPLICAAAEGQRFCPTGSLQRLNRLGRLPQTSSTISFFNVLNIAIAVTQTGASKTSGIGHDGAYRVADGNHTLTAAYFSVSADGRCKIGSAPEAQSGMRWPPASRSAELNVAKGETDAEIERCLSIIDASMRYRFDRRLHTRSLLTCGMFDWHLSDPGGSRRWCLDGL